MNWICENDIHKRLSNLMPNMFPKIYAYEEQKYIDIDESLDMYDDYLDIPCLHLYEVEDNGYSEGIDNINLWNEQFTSDIHEIVNNAIGA